MEEEDLTGTFDDDMEPVFIIHEEEIPTEPVPAKSFPFVTIMLIATNIIAYIMCIGVEDYVHVAGTNYEYITMGGEYGRLLSSMFIHMNVSHLLGNMFGLYVFGVVVEKKLGGFRMAIIYFVSGIVGNIASIYLYHAFDPETMHFSVGASGAVYGLTCAYVFLMLKRENRANKSQMTKAVMFTVALLLFGYFVEEEYEQNVNLVAHLVGAVTGGITAFLLSIRKWEFFNENMFFRLLAVLLTGTLCIVGVGEAHIGDPLAELPSEYVDYIKAQRIDARGSDVTYGDGLNAYCTDEWWEHFISKTGEDIVEFDGNARYRGRSVQVVVQFKVTGDCESYEVSYIGLDGKGLTADEANDFLYDVIDK